MKRFTPLALLCLLPVLFVACHSTEARDRKDAQLRKESIERDRPRPGWKNTGTGTEPLDGAAALQ